MNNHLVKHIHHPETREDSTLHVIRVISNPVRYHSRYRLCREQEEQLCRQNNIELYTVECAFGEREFEVTDAHNPNHLQLRTKSEIWIKENMINLGIRRLIPQSAKYLAWIDADVTFRDDNWALETIHQLQHFEVVQPWSDCMDLGPHGNVMQHFKSFGGQHQKRIQKQKWPAQPYPYAHTGFAWACTRRFFEAVGGLVDFAILGSADHHMAFAMIGEVADTIHGKMGFNFHSKLLEWETRAMQVTHKEVGFVQGRIEHHFHGSKKKRYYRERWAILYESKFDPIKDLTYDHHGVIQLVGKSSLEQDIRLYNRSRLEDSIDE